MAHRPRRSSERAGGAALSEARLTAPWAGSNGPDTFAELRRREFGRLDELGLAYLDYTGSGLYAESQVRQHSDFLCRTVLGNPHSESQPSLLATEIMDHTRRRVLDFFDADPDEFTVCFTGNATAAAKLVGEAFPFQDGSELVLTADNHNSVNGVREFARERNATVKYLGFDSDMTVPSPSFAARPGAPSLFAFPAQSNFSGVQHPLDWVSDAQAAGYHVLLDAAAFVPTNPLSLRTIKPDFVCLSFYKMFGYPTGVGALIARTDALAILDRPWFAGGTVEWVTVGTERRRLQLAAPAFEDGTPNFLDIAAVAPGLDLVESVGIEAVHEHVVGLTDALISGLLEIQAETATGGAPRIAVYGPTGTARRGGTVAFNLLDAEGTAIPYEQVERAARDVGIAIRGGCFCNPGASEAAFELDPERSLACFEGVPQGEFHPRELLACFDGAPVGALRASVGIASSQNDVDRLLRFLRDAPAL